jgi:hypothetical protein
MADNYLAPVVPHTPLAAAGYAPDPYALFRGQQVPWYYQAGSIPGQIGSYLSPVLASYLPATFSIRHG